MTAIVPGSDAVLVTENGQATRVLLRFFNALLPPKSSSAVSVGPSPATIVAASKGSFVLSGGAGVSVQLKRGSTVLPLVPVPAIIPVAESDAIVVTYTSAPSITFLGG